MARISSRRDELHIVDDMADGANAQTVQKADGSGRVITMKDTGDYHTNAITLGHESYRDGIVGNKAEQQRETFNAVVGHAGMAARMDDYGTQFDGLFGDEVEAYKKGDMTALMLDSMYNYSSDADFWKLTENGTLIRDGRKSVYIDIGNGEFKLLNYDFLDSDIESFAAMMGLYKNKFSEEQKLLMQQNIKGLSFDEAIQKMNQDYKNNLNVEAAENLVNEFSQGFIQVPHLSNTIGVANSAYHVLTDYLHVDFSEKTFIEILGNIANITKNPLGSYLDLTQIKPYEQEYGYKDGKDYSSNEFFNNLGISYAFVYYTLEQINPELNFESVSTPDAINKWSSKEEWMRDALGETVNQRTGRVSSIGYDEKLIKQQKAYAENKVTYPALADGIQMVSDLTKAACVSLDSKTRVDMWSYDGFDFYTLYSANSAINFNQIPVSAMNYAINNTYKNMISYINTPDSSSKKRWKRWNDFIGWNSKLAHEF